MTDPERASRLWLAMAVATLWVVSVGGEADATKPTSGLEKLPPTHVARRRAAELPSTRQLSCFRRGLVFITAQLVQGRAVPLGQFLPEVWPDEQASARLPQSRVPQT